MRVLKEIRPGDQYNRFTIIERVASITKKTRLFLCLCECGNKRILSAYRITSGQQKSCGCLHKDYLHKRFLKSKKSLLPFYYKLDMVRRNFINRCYNANKKDYSRYQGRGIRVCDEWRNDQMSFYNWAIEAGYRPGLYIDRINNNGNYEPSNCRWTTNQENALNTEKAIKINIGGHMYRTKEMKQIFGVCQQLISRWKKQGRLEQKLKDKLGV